MVKLIASDLDGTLLQNGAQRLSPEVFDMIRTLKSHGILFTAASGRQYTNLRRLFAPVKDDIAYVAENGSLSIYEGKTLSKGTVSRNLGLRILDAVRDYGRCECIVSGERVCYTDSRNPRFAEHMLNVVGNDMEFVDDLKTDVEEPFLKLALCDFDGTAHTEAHFKELFSDEIKIVTSGNIWVDFITPGANKGNALQVLLDYLEIDAQDCIAFGDQCNDEEMLQLAGTSYAMSYAPPAALRHASCTTDSVEEALADIIKELE
ncbi:haloacid dehalogenase [Lachnospiraceae bacterium]|uniref:HAD family hydrolase n=1 Tax=Extibacter sp. GGCC_0201 TaxID=2731209 RepID=UPI001AA1317C|nr:HAD family hydrolase [Extibacter sp. GGCC_0201]MBO1721794.1 HAD family hydrolase [Extibacter sp. GGCC_0201]BDF35560.1 haloacid dehalogenase [Lachnospiraceae bacterium]BDF39562.1 haloacid dehalogenase [Lachnospiraceae bacterium]